MDNLQGKWWMSEKPKNIVSGTLEFENNSTYLKLVGHFPDEKTKRTIRFAEIIHGETSDGTYITLLNCDFVKGKYSGNRHSETEYKADIVFLNHHFLSEEDIIFNGIFVRFDFLEKWLELNPFKTKRDDPDDRERFTIEYQNPETQRFELDEFTIYFYYSLSYSSVHHKFENIGVDTRVDVDPKDWINLERTLEIVKYLKNFFSLALGQNISVVELVTNTLYNEKEISENERKKGLLKSISIHTPKLTHKTDEKYRRYRTNIPYEWIKTDFAYTLDKWFKFVKKHAPLYELYFATLYEYEMYPVSEFLALAQGLETYLPKHQSLLVKLERILEMFDFLVPVLTTDKKEFIKTISDNRRWYTHYNDYSDKVLQISELIPYTKKMRVLIMSIILYELGISKDNITKNASVFPPL